jgi:hypothetical protein
MEECRPPSPLPLDAFETMALMVCALPDQAFAAFDATLQAACIKWAVHVLKVAPDQRMVHNTWVSVARMFGQASLSSSVVQTFRDAKGIPLLVHHVQSGYARNSALLACMIIAKNPQLADVKHLLAAHINPNVDDLASFCEAYPPVQPQLNGVNLRQCFKSAFHRPPNW